MNTSTVGPADFTSSPPTVFSYARASMLEAIGSNVLRYALVLVLVLFGLAKFTPAEAMAIKPLVSNSPFMSWMYGVFSTEGASRVIGSIELLTAALIAARPISPRIAALGSALGVGIFASTLSFLFSTPGALAATHPAHGFLLKDIVLLGATVALGTEAIRAAAREPARAAS